MRKPTLEEVKEYFKDAKKMQSPVGKSKYKIDTERLGIYLDGKNYRQNKNSDDQELLLWEENAGYAKILSYKTPKLEITKEQILNLNKYGNLFTSNSLKDMYPSVFKVEFTVGKWYKNENHLIYYKGDERCCGFVILNGSWLEDCGHDLRAHKECNYIEATQEEIFEALKVEAIKRGFVEGCFFKNIHLHHGSIHELKSELVYNNKTNSLYCNFSGWAVFRDGKWATIIPTITKDEAERKLNSKII